MRRSDKEIKDKIIIEEILSNNKILRLALSEDNTPYIIPLNYGYENDCLYFHSFKEGKKIDIIKKNNRASFEVTEKIEIASSDLACDYGTKYRSVLGVGLIEIINDSKEKIKGLNVLMKNHTQKREWNYSDTELNKIVVLKLTIKETTGKQSGYKD
ncbi:MAG TPA: pyridoxamine 5'-phosphate oxidase family protein [Spirochaetota bacterium]|nr:pyridoxamine 5'-phosphate oxidase family protein [Spirochaetota bacterium]